MSVYDEEKHFQHAVRCDYVLTPVPESLTVLCDDGLYFFEEVVDGSSLVWIDLMIDTFCEAFPGVDWMMDDPGTLFDQDESYEDCEESPFSLDKMQEVSQVALSRYGSLFGRLKTAGLEAID